MAKGNKRVTSALTLNIEGDKGLIDPKDGSHLGLWHLPEYARNPKKELKYSSNFNNKLNCQFHTTIRLHSKFWQPDEYYKVMLKGVFCFRALLLEKKTVPIQGIPSITAYLDTGLCLPEAQKLLQKIYGAQVNDWAKQPLDVLLIQNIEY